MKYSPNLVEIAGYKQKSGQEITQQPEPLITNLDPSPEFPVKALGDILGNAAQAISEAVQVPHGISCQSVLAAAALATQGFNNIQIDGRKIPLSLFLMTIAESGDRKSSSDNAALKPVRIWQSEQIKNYSNNIKIYDNQLRAYQTLVKNVINSKKLTQNEMAQKLSELIEPDKPINPKVMSGEPTIEGLIKGFVDGAPSQTLTTDEGGQLFGGHSFNQDNALKTAAILSKLWDAAAIEKVRASKDESFYMENRRLSSHIMFQPIVSDIIMTDQVFLEQGFLARFLISFPKSIAGTRMYNATDINKNSAFDIYCKRISDLLNTPLNTDENGGLIFNILELSDDAKELWINNYNIIETQLSKDGELAHIKPTASKMSENILRIAGVFATIDSTETITLEQMMRAIELGDYYTKSFLWILDNGKKNVLKEQSSSLHEWIVKNIKPGDSIDIRKIVQNAPRVTGCRNNSSHARNLMTILSRHGYTNVVGCNANNKPATWKINVTHESTNKEIK